MLAIKIILGVAAYIGFMLFVCQCLHFGGAAREE